MNLVQIQERLKDAPIQSIMQYANGQNPMVPPYLALAELKRRESISQSAQSQQAMQQGQPRSVKEQIEQTAGLAALQQRMQQQGMQGLMAQARPQGIPEGTPQPSRQPESEGLAGVPVSKDMFNFSDGGIVAFQGGGPTTPAGRVASGIAEKIGSVGSGIAASYREEEEKLKLQEAIREELRSRSGIRGAFTPQTEEQYEKAGKLVDAAMSPAANTEALRNILAEAKQLKQPLVAPPIKPAMPTPDTSYSAKEAARAAAVKTPEGAEMTRGLPMPATSSPPKFDLQGDYETAMQDVMAIRDPAERAAAFQALQKVRRQPAPQEAEPMAATAGRGLPAIAGSDEAQKMMLEAMRSKTTPEAAYESDAAMDRLYGLTTPYGEERMKRAQAMEAARQQELEGRGMERLMRVMGGIGARGLGGAGTAYLQSIEGERAADAAFRKQMDELLGGVEKERRAEALSRKTGAQKRIEEERKLGLGAAEKVYDADARLKLQELQQKAAMGRLSSEEQYIMSELQKGKSYPKIIAEIAEAKAGPRTETAEQQRYKDTYLKVAAAYDAKMIPPKDISRDEWIRREVDRAMGSAPIAASSGGKSEKELRAESILAGGK